MLVNAFTPADDIEVSNIDPNFVGTIKLFQGIYNSKIRYCFYVKIIVFNHVQYNMSFHFYPLFASKNQLSLSAQNCKQQFMHKTPNGTIKK